MTNGRTRLNAQQVHDAGLDDWRQIQGRLKARFRTRTFTTGLTLLNQIGAAAEEADHHPDLTLTYTDLVVTLSSHDVRGITSRDIDLARQITACAGELEVQSDPSGLTQLELGLDTAQGEHLAPFYAALLGSRLVHGEPVDSSGQVPTLWWQGPDASDDAVLAEQTPQQRWHFDVWVAHDEAERRVQAALDAGGQLVSEAEAPAYWVLADSDGNRSCICTPTGRWSGSSKR